MGKEENKNFFDRLWDMMASVKLAIVVFALISLTSIVGTVVEQNASPETNINILRELVGSTLAPRAYNLLMAMGFMDMYRSWWFISLLMLFAANLLICSLDRFPAIWRIVRKPMRPLKDEQFGNMPIRKEFVLRAKAGGGEEKLAGFLLSMGFKHPESTGEGGGRQLYAQRGRYSRLGVYITHLSMIIIMIGAVIGVFFGFKGFLNLPEGDTYPIAFGRGQLTHDQSRERDMILEALESTGGDFARTASLFGVSEDRLKARMRTVGMEPLGFSVRCDDFEVSFYENTDMPKEYTSHLTVLEGGREVMSKWIEVNSPLKYKRYTFYQSSYGMMSNPEDFVFRLRLSAWGGSPKEIEVRKGESFAIPGSDIEASVAEFSPALAFDRGTGRPFTYTETMNNPAMRLLINEGGKERSRWITKRRPATWAIDGSHTVELMDVWGAQYTGLQVRRDPGVWVVYLGCLIMSIGLYMAFFTGHRRIWIKVAGEKGAAKVTVAANAHKGREAFERKIDRSISLLTEGGKQ